MIVENASMENIVRMIDFLKKDSFVIPHYNMQMPEEANGDNFRPEKSFRLHKDGYITYYGSGGIPKQIKPDICKYSIKANQAWLDRAYVHLADDVREKIKKTIEGFAFSKRFAKLILKFNGLDFLNIY